MLDSISGEEQARLRVKSQCASGAHNLFTIGGSQAADLGLRDGRP